MRWFQVQEGRIVMEITSEGESGEEEREENKGGGGGRKRRGEKKKEGR